MTVTLGEVVPILRIFDVARAREFYCDFLGFTVEWEHRFSPDAPLYMQVKRSGVSLHLSEHHGDGTPGTAVYITVTGIVAFHAELATRNYKYNRPGLMEQEWGMREMYVTDPFGNTLRFGEPMDKAG